MSASPDAGAPPPPVAVPDSEVRPGSGEMFDRIARRYDLVNRVLSLGLDRAWRRRTAAALELGAGGKILDLATGTGDLALALLARYPDATLVGVDPSAAMLAIARDKFERRALASRTELRVGVAEELPFEAAQFDAVTIAFGLRNVPDRQRALGEMARVTRPGGRIAVLELGEPRGRILGPLARFHIHRVVPRLGALLSGAREYRYLERSIAAFPPPEKVAEMMVRAGLEPTATVELTLGACHLVLARRGAPPGSPRTPAPRFRGTLTTGGRPC
jgi:demethylmenaquinone methyltransferase/2-methoxy-6-polyprenyl-1,4-benzoquinol methylase